MGYGYDVDYTLRGLARVDLTLEELKKKGRENGRSRCRPPRRSLAVAGRDSLRRRDLWHLAFGLGAFHHQRCGRHVLHADAGQVADDDFIF